MMAGSAMPKPREEAKAGNRLQQMGRRVQDQNREKGQRIRDAVGFMNDLVQGTHKPTRENDIEEN